MSTSSPTSGHTYQKCVQGTLVPHTTRMG